MKRYITLLTAFLTTIAGMTQTTNDTINRMVLVESTYNPIIAGAVKRNFIPEEIKPTMNKEEVVYANENVDLTNFDRKAKPAQAITVVPEKGTPGYAHIGYGNYNNLRSLAAYKFRFNKNNDLAIKAHADGWNGKFKLDNNTKWRSHLYNVGVETDYNTMLGNVALNAGLYATYYNYNYLTSSNDIQHANRLGGYVRFKGSIQEDYSYQADIQYTHYGRSILLGNKTPHHEGHLHGEATLSKDLYEWGMASVLLRSDVLSYQGLANYHNYFSLGLTPHWTYRYGDLHFVSGLNLDLLFGKNVAHPFQVSPACSISYVPDKPFTAKLTLDGGRSMNTYSHLYAISPYWASLDQVKPTYTFLNTHLSGNLRIIEGLHLHLGGGYRILSNALFETVMETTSSTYTGITNHNAQVASFDAGVSYSHKDVINISAKGAYHHWMLQANRALLARAPQLKADLDARVRIIPKLYAYTDLQLVSFTNTKVAARERAIIDWGLGAQYSLNKRFTVFLDGNNLLNHRHQYFTGYPSQGFNVLAGVMVKF